MNEQKINVVPYPFDPTEERYRHERRFLCPECENSYLPFDPYTECDNCGAHLELYVKTVAPPVTDE